MSDKDDGGEAGDGWIEVPLDPFLFRLSGGTVIIVLGGFARTIGWIHFRASSLTLYFRAPDGLAAAA